MQVLLRWSLTRRRVCGGVGEQATECNMHITSSHEPGREKWDKWGRKRAKGRNTSALGGLSIIQHMAVCMLLSAALLVADVGLAVCCCN